jgi:formate hydrogenlyase transcriptional activator
LSRFNPQRDERGNILRWYVAQTDIEESRQTSERTRNENLALREEVARSSMFEEILGSSDKLVRVLSEVARVAISDSTVLILGETGTGKELIARAIHKQSKRSARAFIRVKTTTRFRFQESFQKHKRNQELTRDVSVRLGARIRLGPLLCLL